MTQSLKIDRAKTAVVIMDFQQRIIANNASEPRANITGPKTGQGGSVAAEKGWPRVSFGPSS